MSARAVPDLLVDVLVDAGITHVFGLPGGNTMEFWKALHGREHQIRAIVPRDEQTAACMADLYGKLTGKPGVFCAQGVFAGSIGMFGVIEGFLSHTPMLVMSEMSEVDRFIFHGPMQGATGSYGSVDLPAILGAATKYVAVAHHPREAVMGTQLALKHALAGCPGPTAVLYRSNASCRRTSSRPSRTPGPTWTCRRRSRPRGRSAPRPKPWPARGGLSSSPATACASPRLARCCDRWRSAWAPRW
jgi:acetolactate synthase-1/2/3 large subunit